MLEITSTEMIFVIDITSTEMIFMIAAIYSAINESVPKLTAQKTGSSCAENKTLCKNNLS